MERAENIPQGRQLGRYRDTLLRLAAIGGTLLGAATLTNCGENSGPREAPQGIVRQIETPIPSLTPAAPSSSAPEVLAVTSTPVKPPESTAFKDSKQAEGAVEFGNWRLTVNQWTEIGGQLEKRDLLRVIVGSSIENKTNKILPLNSLEQNYIFRIEASSSPYLPTYSAFYGLEGNKKTESIKLDSSSLPPGQGIFMELYFEIPEKQKDYSFEVIEANTEKSLGKVNKGKVGK